MTILASLVFAALLCAPPRQDPPPAQDPPKEAPAEIVRLTAWPKLEGEAGDKSKVEVEKLRKARTPQMADDAVTSLVAAGAGAAPLLLVALAKEQDPAAQKRVIEVLDKLTSAEHTRLLGAEFENKAATVRLYALRRAAAFPDPGLREKAEAALARAAKGGDKAESFAAALCTTSTGSLAGLEVLFETAQAAWGKHGLEIRVVLERVRGPEATKLVVAKLRKEDQPSPTAPALKTADRQRVVAALNMLAGCGDPSAKHSVKPFLDSTDNSIRVAAINAARGILDGEQPVPEMSVFEAVETAKKMKARL